jgi:hypothetical protein
MMWKGSDVITRSGDMMSLVRAHNLIKHSDMQLYQNMGRERRGDDDNSHRRDAQYHLLHDQHGYRNTFQYDIMAIQLRYSAQCTTCSTAEPITV